MDIRAILFDIGDTLLDATGIQKQALSATAKELAACHLIPDMKAFLATYRQVDAEMEAIDLNHLYSDLRLIEHTLAALHLPLDNRVTGFFLTRYRDRVRRAITRDESLIALFDKLSARCELGIVSNGTTVEQLEQLVRLGIIGFLNPIVISQQVNLTKPDPRFFELATQRLREHRGVPDLDSAHVLVVGDRPEVDVRGARLAGMKAALITRYVDNRAAITGADLQPDRVIADVHELLSL